MQTQRLTIILEIERYSRSGFLWMRRPRSPNRHRSLSYCQFQPDCSPISTRQDQNVEHTRPLRIHLSPLYLKMAFSKKIESLKVFLLCWSLSQIYHDGILITTSTGPQFRKEASPRHFTSIRMSALLRTTLDFDFHPTPPHKFTASRRGHPEIAHSKKISTRYKHRKS